MRIKILSNSGLFFIGLIAIILSFNFAENAATGIEPTMWYAVASAFSGLIGMIMYLELLSREPENDDEDELDDYKQDE